MADLTRVVVIQVDDRGGVRYLYEGGGRGPRYNDWRHSLAAGVWRWDDGDELHVRVELTARCGVREGGS